MHETFDLSLHKAMATMGYRSFKSSEQETLVRGITEGQDALGILPTGGGKSACFILPTLANNWCTVVVSPLKSLMEDQVQKLKALGITAFALHSEMDVEEKLIAILTLLHHGDEPMFLYSSPEMLLSDWFWDHFGDNQVNLLAVDEGHCASTWGETFRPNYLRIKEIARRFGNPQTAVFSATIDLFIEDDVVRLMPLRKNFLKVRASPYRENLKVRVAYPGAKQKKRKHRDRKATMALMRCLEDETYDGPSIVYCSSRAGAGNTFQLIRDHVRDLGYYPILFHSQIASSDKWRGLAAFQSEEKPLVIGTTAFGMGIDRADVRRVIHFDSPYNLNEYAQQIGRAGRDGEESLCLALYNDRQVDSIEKHSVNNVPAITFVESIYKRLAKAWLAKPKEHRREFSLIGFEQRYIRGIRSNDSLSESAKGLVIQKVSQSLSILRRTGYIRENDNGLSVRKFEQGSARHLRLLEVTKMSERSFAREASRIRKFFRHEAPTQRLLWEILGS